MGEFFAANCSKFEQDFDNYQKQGEVSVERKKEWGCAPTF
jgi:hypothetical protein